ncbi:MAG: DNA-3-methyladenine glycosylase 2 family protein, partial [Actinomycetota bacterium]
MDEEHMYRAIRSKDPRFDGWFFTAVVTTGIYCRPSCPAIIPKRSNVRFHPTAASAQQAGFRACKRCRPDATPGSPEWNTRSDLVARAMRLLADGIIEREGVNGLASRLGYSERHLNRQMVAELGTGPLAIARAQRAQTARILIETTRIPMSEVAFASGFASIRQFNDTIREVFALVPSQLRRSAAKDHATEATGRISLRLAYRPPISLTHLFTFLAARAIAGTEEGSEHHFARTLCLPYGPGIVELRKADDTWIQCHLQLSDLRDLGTAVQRCRRLLDLDADPAAIQSVLGADPILRRTVKRWPGLRIPGHVDGAELATRAVLGQQVSVVAAKRHAEQLVQRFGKPLTAAYGSLTHLFPAPEVIAEAPDEDLRMPSARRKALRAVATLLADATLSLDAGTDRDEAS